MAGLTRQALIVSASRFINQGLMVISPVILVRLLTVQDFGEYREFLMYVARRYRGRFWNALPREVARYCRQGMTATVSDAAARGEGEGAGPWT